MTENLPDCDFGVFFEVRSVARMSTTPQPPTANKPKWHEQWRGGIRTSKIAQMVENMVVDSLTRG